MMQRSVESAASSTRVRFIGFCGVDDSVDPEFLLLLSERYPWIEWGVLFRPEVAGTPRFASEQWLVKLSECCKRSGGRMRLAGHLCSSRCQEILGGDTKFVESLLALGFRRIQVNATAANGVDTTRLAECAEAVRSAITRLPEIEWILQRNGETKPLWEPILAGPSLPNVSVLFDESVGTGAKITAFPAPLGGGVKSSGYAGGIGPANIAEVLDSVRVAAAGSQTWIDMESSLRSTVDGKDTFDLNKAFACTQAAVASGLLLGEDA